MKVVYISAALALLSSAGSVLAVTLAGTSSPDVRIINTSKLPIIAVADKIGTNEESPKISTEGSDFFGVTTGYAKRSNLPPQDLLQQIAQQGATDNDLVEITVTSNPNYKPGPGRSSDQFTYTFNVVKADALDEDDADKPAQAAQPTEPQEKIDLEKVFPGLFDQLLTDKEITPYLMLGITTATPSEDEIMKAYEQKLARAKQAFSDQPDELKGLEMMLSIVTNTALIDNALTTILTAKNAPSQAVLTQYFPRVAEKRRAGKRVTAQDVLNTTELVSQRKGDELSKAIAQRWAQEHDESDPNTTGVLLLAHRGALGQDMEAMFKKVVEHSRARTRSAQSQ